MTVDLRAHLQRSLDPLPAGALVPVEWVRGLVDECGGTEGVDLTVQEVATMLDRAPSTIRTWCGEGKFPDAYRLEGREWRIPRKALRALGKGGADGKEIPVQNGRVKLSGWRERVPGGAR